MEPSPSRFHNLPLRPPQAPPSVRPERPERPPPAAQPEQGQQPESGDDREGDSEEREEETGRHGTATPAKKAGVPGSRPVVKAVPNLGATPRITAKAANTAHTSLPPPPPAGSPATVWNHYLKVLPPSHQNRQAVRAEINKTAQEMPRSQRIEALRQYAHSDEERQFLEYTSVLPTLDEDMDADIYRRESQRRAAAAARARARSAYLKQRREFRESVASTRQWLDSLPDSAESRDLRQQFDDALSAHGGPSQNLLNTFTKSAQGYAQVLTAPSAGAAGPVATPSATINVPDSAPSLTAAASDTATLETTGGQVKVAEGDSGVSPSGDGTAVDSGQGSTPGLSEGETGPSAEGKGLHGGFNEELEAFNAPRGLQDGSLADSPEFQALLQRMRESGIYTPEALAGIEADAKAFDQRVISQTLEALPEGVSKAARDRIEAGEEPFAVLRAGVGVTNLFNRLEAHSGAALENSFRGVVALGINAKQMTEYAEKFEEYTGKPPTWNPETDQETLDRTRALNRTAAKWTDRDGSRLDTEGYYTRLKDEYAEAFKEYAKREPTFDPEVDNAVLADMEMRYLGPDVGIRPSRELLAGSLADAGAPPPVPTVGPLAGATAQPTATPGPGPSTIQEWQDLETVYIHGKAYDVNDLIGKFGNAGAGRTPAQKEASLEKLYKASLAFLQRGHLQGAITTEPPKALPTDNLTWESLGDTFYVDGVEYDTAEYRKFLGDLRNQVLTQHGDPVALAVQSFRGDFSEEATEASVLATMNRAYKAGRVTTQAQGPGVPFYPVPGYRGSDFSPGDLFLPGFSAVQSAIRGSSANSPGGALPTPAEASEFRTESLLATAEIATLPLTAAAGPVLRSTGKGVGRLIKVVRAHDALTDPTVQRYLAKGYKLADAQQLANARYNVSYVMRDGKPVPFYNSGAGTHTPLTKAVIRPQPSLSVSPVGGGPGYYRSTSGAFQPPPPLRSFDNPFGGYKGVQSRLTELDPAFMTQEYGRIYTNPSVSSDFSISQLPQTGGIGLPELRLNPLATPKLEVNPRMFREGVGTTKPTAQMQRQPWQEPLGDAMPDIPQMPGQWDHLRNTPTGGGGTGVVPDAATSMPAGTVDPGTAAGATTRTNVPLAAQPGVQGKPVAQLDTIAEPADMVRTESGLLVPASAAATGAVVNPGASQTEGEPQTVVETPTFISAGQQIKVAQMADQQGLVAPRSDVYQGIDTGLANRLRTDTQTGLPLERPGNVGAGLANPQLTPLHQNTALQLGGVTGVRLTEGLETKGVVFTDAKPSIETNPETVAGPEVGTGKGELPEPTTATPELPELKAPQLGSVTTVRAGEIITLDPQKKKLVGVPEAPVQAGPEPRARAAS